MAISLHCDCRLLYTEWRLNCRKIKSKQLCAVQSCVTYLKKHKAFRGLFINYGSKVRVKIITEKIQKGDENLLNFLVAYNSPRECATALNCFIRKLNYPLLTNRVQKLVLAKNFGVCPRIIALDALNLLCEGLKGNQRELFISVMDLMKTLSTTGSLKPSELRVSYAPYLLMPILFSFEVSENLEQISQNWKSIADILNEMVLNFNSFEDDGHYQLDSPIFVTTSNAVNSDIFPRPARSIILSF